eukprot:CAMPEP_0196995444 /NCGR_PEP_ID=MMETSP1380-20130617/1555_1 /TAXON_ID=5936 /ORGANISM="Euplotes crassus, Strain CT5" /LENGTH=102 /DNA_ID=CAMNT_0042411111 /DNA_START=293 /DNA_END=601 /DNA_ORIENTATION=+
MAPASSTAPSQMTLLAPMTTSLPMVHDESVQSLWMVTLAPISTSASWPVGSEATVWITVLSPTDEYAPIETAFMSPLMTTLFHTVEYESMHTSPLSVADSAT